MRNVKVTVAKNIATITIDLTQDLGPSSTGKTHLVGTTEGNVTIPGTEIKLGVNCFKKAA